MDLLTFKISQGKGTFARAGGFYVFITKTNEENSEFSKVMFQGAFLIF